MMLRATFFATVLLIVALTAAVVRPAHGQSDSVTLTREQIQQIEDEVNAKILEAFEAGKKEAQERCRNRI